MSTSIFCAVAGEGWKAIQKKYWYHLYHTNVIEETIYLYSNRLTLGLSTCLSYARWCMTGFDLLTNYLDDLEVLLRKAKASLKKVLTLESEDNRIRRSLTPEFEAIANKTLRILCSNHHQHSYQTANRCWREWIQAHASCYQHGAS
jgi:hypothetical protein